MMLRNAEKKVCMIKNFDTNRGIVFAEVVTVLRADCFLVRNGDPGQIFCHCRQGGDLEVSSSGHLILVQNRTIISPSVGEQVVLIRESNDRNNRDYTRAARWVPIDDWEESSWAVNAKETFRATAYDHRCNGHFQNNSGKDVLLTEGTLMEIVKKNPRSGNNDCLGAHYAVGLGTKTLTYNVRWERWCPDGWVECGDPRP